MQNTPEPEVDLRVKLNRETGRLAWAELAKHFASGNMVWVAGELDLVDVAVRISQDDKTSVADWMDAGQIAKVSDAQAQTWLAAEATLWAVVVSPFILVQQEKRTVH